MLEQAGVRRDLRAFTRAMRPAVTRHAATQLPAFDRPVLQAWATDDRLFPLAHAHALAALLPDAQVALIAGSRAYSMLDQTDVLARLSPTSRSNTPPQLIDEQLHRLPGQVPVAERSLRDDGVGSR